MSTNTYYLLTQALNGSLNQVGWDYLERTGMAVRMNDGRLVVTLPTRDAYFRQQQAKRA